MTLDANPAALYTAKNYPSLNFYKYLTREMSEREGEDLNNTHNI
jgi:hypothetical protein